MPKFESMVIKQVNEQVTKVWEEMKTRLKEESRQNWMVKYMSSHYSPHSGPFGYGTPPPPANLCSNVFIVVK
jgi:hypothetical protein